MSFSVSVMPSMCRKLRTPSSSFLRYENEPFPWQSLGMGMRERIQAIIDANPDFTVRSVSLAAGMSDSMLGKFLKGQTDSMTIKTAEKLAEALNVDPIWLTYGEGSPERANELDLLFREIPAESWPQAIAILETFKRTGTTG